MAASCNPKEIFLTALEIASPAERQAYLDSACAGDAVLRRQVEELLEHEAALGSFLQAPAAPRPTLDHLAADRPGMVLGHYKLLEEIGEGGMGTVWMARQTEPVKRLVAVKLIKPGMHSQQVIARFEAERQALALMDHPNIAKVLDGGTTNAGRPYFVMELVKGVPITKYCDERRLTPRQRLELFLPVCQAVQHAHQKGIIHRDLKPSNVLVALYDGEPVPKVIDFGVAKAIGQPLTEQTLATGFGAIVGTLEYMSPEQAELNQLDIDTRSDIYSLGVVLYELLTGTTPLERKRVQDSGLVEALRIIREEEVPTLSSRLSSTAELPAIAANRGTEPARLIRWLRGELDWIVTKCLEKDRNRRYETANGLALDVQRYLADEPVQACPPSVGYRLRKFLRRRRGWLVAATVLATAFLMALAGIFWGVRSGAAAREAVARAQAEQQREVEDEIRQTLDEVLAEYQRGKIPGALAALRRAESSAELLNVHAELADQLQKWRKELDLIADAERIRQERNLLEEDGKVNWAANDRAYREAFLRYGLDVEAIPPAEVATRLQGRPVATAVAVALDDWAFVRRQLNKPGQFTWRHLVELAKMIDADPVRNQLRGLWGQPVDEMRQQVRELARAANLASAHPTTIVLLARVLRTAGLSSQAEAVLREGQEKHPGDFWINYDLAQFLMGDGPVRTGEAVAFSRAAVALRPDSPLSQVNLGVALARQGKLAQAERAYREAIRQAPKYAYAYYLLGKNLTDQRRWNEAIAAYEQAIALEIKFSGAYADLAKLLANCQDERLRDPARAAERARKAIELEPRSSWAWQQLGWAEYRLGNWQAAVEALEKSCELQGNPERGDSFQWLVLAMACQRLGQVEAARQWYEKTLGYERVWPEELVRLAAEASRILHESEPPSFAHGVHGMKLVRCVQAHLGGPVRIAVSPDQTTVASISQHSSEVLLWDTPITKVRQSLDGMGRGLFAVRYSADGTCLAVAGYQGRVIVWDVNRLQRQFYRDDLGEIAWDVAFLKGDSILATGVGGPPGIKLKLFDLDSQKLLYQYESAAIQYLDVSPDGRLLACALGWLEDNENVLLVDWESGSQKLLQGHRGGTHALKFLPNRHELITGGQDRMVRRWRVGDKRELWASQPLLQAIEAVAVSRDGKWLAVGSEDWARPARGGEIHIWDVASGELVATGFQPGGACDAEFVERPRPLLLVGNRLGQVFVWDLQHEPGANQSAVPAPSHTRPIEGFNAED